MKTEHEKVKSRAKALSIVSIILALAGILFAVLGALSVLDSMVTDGKNYIAYFSIAGTAIVWAAVLFLVAQLLHVRAALEKIASAC